MPKSAAVLEFPPNSPQVVTGEMQARIRWAVRRVKLQSMDKIEEFLLAGAMPNEIGVWLEEPLVQLAEGLIVVQERMRVL